MLTYRKDTEIKKAAKDFAAYWKDKGYEKGESQKFWLELLSQVYGVENPSHFVEFEEQVKLDNTSFIDVMIPSTHVMIEQKSINKDLRKGIKQSDGSFLTPFQQAKRYSAELPYSQRPRWIVTCNFKEFLVYDMEMPNGEPESILLENLPKEYYRLNFLTDTGDENIKREMEISIQAGEIVGHLYDAISKQYVDLTNEHTLKSLNMLCVRLVFCFYAEDAGVFGKHLMFHDYLKGFEAKHFRKALIELFETLNTKPEDRDPYMDDDLAAFPYVNGGLFADEKIEIPQFTDEIISLILKNASEDFDWSEISPTIFGAVFESTLNPETRRSGGMHYTSIENIHKVIDPLFLDELKEEFEEIKEVKQINTRNDKLNKFCDKLASLKFLDPACGSGNFLTETYISLRRLENEALKLIRGTQIGFDESVENLVKVSIDQFYGIEINDFAVTVAKTALWIAESQMLKQTEEIVNVNIDFLPLTTNAFIVEGNALCLDWNDVVPATKLNYIMGNPPFVGARLMSKEQKADLLSVFGKKWKNAGNLDYVSCWYKKAADYMLNTCIFAALVSTNSVSQGESVANLWKPLFENGIIFNFAHRTFRWDSEASIKAQVHCVIIGFSYVNKKIKTIYNNGSYKNVETINGYLLDTEIVFIESRNKSICFSPKIGIGNKPIDGGFYLFKEKEKDDFIKKEPKAEDYFVPWYGAQEFINNKPRYCLWLGDCPPNQLRQMPECLKRVKAVREYRLNSPSAGTIKLADKPTRFHVENIQKSTYLIIPSATSNKRKYIPIGFMQPNCFASNLVLVVSGAELYHFGVLTSNVHMAWTKVVCGRLGDQYRYSANVVYNNFPWCNPTVEQKTKIEKTAQAILDARALYSECSLADLYDELTMPPELLKAHQNNDRAVMAAYGFSTKMTESECVAELMKMYQELVN